LENLLFFNTGQRKVVSGIISSIELYGLPYIIVNNESTLKIIIGKLLDVQTIYAIDDSIEPNPLAGILIYFRESIENIVILHIAVNEKYSLEGSNGNSFLTLHLIEELKKIAIKLKGVKTLTIYYHKDVIGKINVMR
jgi:hypothetical protein